MTRGQPVALCPMLEQEVAGYNLLLQTLVVLSRGMDVDSGEPVEGGAGWPFAQVSYINWLPFPALLSRRLWGWLLYVACLGVICSFVRSFVRGFRVCWSVLSAGLNVCFGDRFLRCFSLLCGLHVYVDRA